jgi:hypothetical protein
MSGKSALVWGTAVIGVAAATYLACAGRSVNTILPVPASMTASVTAEGCSNNPGPYITLAGELTIAGIDARLIFRNNEKGTHERTEDVVVDITLLEDEVIRFAKQPSQGGVGGNPWIFLQLFDHEWNPISNRVLLGRCVQGLEPAEFDFLHLTDVSMNVSGDCSNNPGPFITLTGELSFDGVNAVLTFQNSRNNPPHVRDEVVNVDIVILPPGESIRFAKQPPLGGVGGNPRIYLQFVDHEGSPLSDEIYLGRCVQLSR